MNQSGNFEERARSECFVGTTRGPSHTHLHTPQSCNGVTDKSDNGPIGQAVDQQHHFKNQHTTRTHHEAEERRAHRTQFPARPRREDLRLQPLSRWDDGILARPRAQGTLRYVTFLEQPLLLAPPLSNSREIENQGRPILAPR